MLNFLACILALTLGSANAKQRHYTLNILDANVNPDGYTRPAVTVDGTFGRLLTAERHDDFQVEVNNQLNDPRMLKGTSIHWHGIFQHRTAAMDGPAFVTQCPIASGYSFKYKFPTGGQTGTYWYHSHYATQYCDGLRGPIVVYDPQDPYQRMYDVDDASTVITFADWYHTFAPVLSGGPPPRPDSHLINGLGRIPGNTTQPLSVISVQKGKRYRMRLVNIACSPNYLITFEGHTMTVIEADGITTKPQVVNSLQIFVGQRYSVIVTADQPIGNYWIRASPSNGPQGFVGGINSAILRYQGAPVLEPNGTAQTLGTTLLEQNLIPYSDPTPPGGHNPPDVPPFVFNIVFSNGSFLINGASYESPSVPILLQILNGADPKDLLPKGSVYVLPRNSVIEISVPGGSPGAPHPFHLHGHKFSVVRSAGQTLYNYDNPVQRDVVSTGKSTSDFTTIRFRTDNPGPWIFHCHIDWHLGKGLAVVFAEDPAGQVKGPQSQKHNKAWDQLCPIWDSIPDSDH
ncbi:laccase [Cantharellus anzutake]|uniref:laccase n=1 Tax=Cantharellus anzutake TaxID=1750568 RepID=UPI0019084F0F|nr:laccase [Cantharellus anzutake]KAF8335679.1 laccase [Cantharellus anzutake]